MPTELEELVEFLHHGNTQIRQLAAENVLPYTTSQPSLFKRDQLLPIRDLKLLVKDYTPISKNALTALINLADDREVLQCLATDNTFLESLLLRITSASEPNANEIAMLLANMAKSDDMRRIFTLTRAVPKGLSTSDKAMDQLMDCFVKGAEGSYNKHADYDYLSYFFADMAKHPEGQSYFTTPQPYDSNILPITKLTPFTEHASTIRRAGVASTLKNVAFAIPSHPTLLSSSPNSGANLLPYILLPITGPEDYPEDDVDAMLPDLQLLPPDKKRDPDPAILTTHLETLMLLTTTREGRDLLRDIRVYPIVRETHLGVEDEAVREACDRLVQVLMRDEEGEEKPLDPAVVAAAQASKSGADGNAGGAGAGVSIGGGWVGDGKEQPEKTVVDLEAERAKAEKAKALERSRRKAYEDANRASRAAEDAGEPTREAEREVKEEQKEEEEDEDEQLVEIF
ncbi:MAG: hypothetical protein M1819_001665 [Sarea resinae]|nr:MAG: hypothetical protein M1819_001665 [Sarea resinae]